MLLVRWLQRHVLQRNMRINTRFPAGGLVEYVNRNERWTRHDVESAFITRFESRVVYECFTDLGGSLCSSEDRRIGSPDNTSHQSVKEEATR